LKKFQSAALQQEFFFISQAFDPQLIPDTFGPQKVHFANHTELLLYYTCNLSGFFTERAPRMMGFGPFCRAQRFEKLSRIPKIAAGAENPAVPAPVGAGRTAAPPESIVQCGRELPRSTSLQPRLSGP